VRRRVSGARDMVKYPVVALNVVTVRQVPFMEMESPRVQSDKKEGVERMVNVVPVWGSCLISVMAGRWLVFGGVLRGCWRRLEEVGLLPINSTIPVNILASRLEDWGLQRCD